MTCVTLVKAALARFLFAIHALMTIWRVVQQEGDDYWKLAVGILCLLGEGTLHSDQFYYISGYKNEPICIYYFLDSVTRNTKSNYIHSQKEKK